MHFGNGAAWKDFMNMGTGSDYNLSHDDSADDVGSNSLINKAAATQFVSITATSEDLHLKAGADCIDAGSDLGSPYDYDIDNVLRSGTWDIGADELVAAGPSFQPYQMGRMTPGHHLQRGLVT
jgi:hypothetical protein